MRTFISYRRNDTTLFLVPRIREELIRAFGDDTVFLDVDSVPLGADFRNHVRAEIAKTDTVLVVIGANWQPERLVDESDIVRLELLAAVELGTTVVPVLAGGRAMLTREELPAELEWLVWRNAYAIGLPPHDREDIARLVEYFVTNLHEEPSTGQDRQAPDGDASVEASPQLGTTADDDVVDHDAVPHLQQDSRLVHLRVVHTLKAPSHVGLLRRAFLPPSSSLSFSADGLRVAESRGDAVHLWRLGEPRLERVIRSVSSTGDAQSVRRVRFSPDGALIATGGEGPVRLWDVSTGALRRELDDEAHPWSGFAPIRREFEDVAFSPDGVVVAGANRNGEVYLWYVSDGSFVRRARVTDDDWVRSLQFSPDGALLAAAGGTDVHVTTTASGEDVKRFVHHASVAAIAFSPDGEFLASAGLDRTVRISQLDRAGRDVVIDGLPRPAGDIAYSPSGTILGGCIGRSIKLWDPRTGDEVGSAISPAGTVEAIGFSCDPTLMGSAGAKGIVHLWKSLTY